jgi:ribosome-associated translation inhibitor RaiA
MYRKTKCASGTKKDLSQAIDFLLEEIEKGNVKMKTYKQMKMYNDESLNPVLYQKSKN